MSDCGHAPGFAGESWIEQDSYGLWCTHCSQRWVRMGGKMDTLRAERDALAISLRKADERCCVLQGSLERLMLAVDNVLDDNLLKKDVHNWLFTVREFARAALSIPPRGEDT